MGPLAYVLAGRAATGSFAAGGLLAGANAFGQGFAAPLSGRRLDRRETRSALAGSVAIAGVMFAVLAVAVSSHASLIVLLPLGFLSGACVAGLPGGYRALLAAGVDGPLLDVALTVDAALIEVIWITGPPLAGAIIALRSATVALAVMAALAAASTLLTLRLPRRPVVRASSPSRGVFTRPAVPIYAVGFGMGLAFGGVDFGFAPLARAVGAGPAGASALLALLAFSSGVSALVYGTRNPSASSSRRVGIGLAVWAIMLAPLSTIPSLWVGVPFTLVAGLPIAMLNAQISLLLKARVPQERQAEAFSVVWSAMTIGAGIGSTIGAACESPFGARSVFVVIPALVLVLGVSIAMASAPPRAVDIGSHGPT